MLNVQCPKHPRYKGKLKPRASCERCNALYQHEHGEIIMMCPWFSEELRCELYLAPCKPRQYCRDINNGKFKRKKGDGCEALSTMW
jgi:hypothetical protein